MSDSGNEEDKLQELPRIQVENKRKLEANTETSDKEPDETDARGFLSIFSPKRKKSSQLQVTTITEPVEQKNAEQYNMRHRRRGVALIFNHVTFPKMAPRTGSDKDCEDLQATVEALGFEVRVHKDLTRKRFKGVLQETSEEDHSDADCLLVVVMTHGKEGILYAWDTSYKEEELWSKFTADKCASLGGKPKLFIIQACRGDKVDSGVRISTTVTDSMSTTYTIPIQADILIAYSTVPGYYSWRNTGNGSWYIQALCKELSENGRKRDLLAMLTFVNQRVANDYLSMVPSNESKHKKNQMPTFNSMLRRLVYFHENRE